MTCKDCLHYDACEECFGEFRCNFPPRTDWADTCSFFSDKSEWVHLPCKVGDMVYEITTSEEIKQRKVKDIIYDNDGFRLRLEPYFSYEYYLNETVFLTREEAEKALEDNRREDEGK